MCPSKHPQEDFVLLEYEHSLLLECYCWRPIPFPTILQTRRPKYMFPMHPNINCNLSGFVRRQMFVD